MCWIHCLHLARKVQSCAFLDRLKDDARDEGCIIARDGVSTLILQRTGPSDDDPIGFSEEMLDGGLTEKGAEETDVVWVEVVSEEAGRGFGTRQEHRLVAAAFGRSDTSLEDAL